MKIQNMWGHSAAIMLLAVLFSHVGVTSAAPGTVAFDLVFPLGFGLNGITVGASKDIVLGPGDRILATDGSPGTLTNSGSGPITVGPDTTAGNLVSTGNIQLGPGVTAASAQSSGAVTLGNGDTVGQVTQGATLTPLVHRTVIVRVPSGTPSNVSIGSGRSAKLAPGRYGGVMIAPSAVVTVSAGTYLIDDFVLAPLARLQLDTSGGTVIMYAKNSAALHGAISGDATRFIFGFLGQGSLNFDSGFSGTAFAPFGTLALQPASTPYQGTFYAAHVVIQPGVTVRQLPTPLLIDGLNVSNTTPCVAGSIEVSVQANGAGPGATTWIQGVVGSHQFVQFGDATGPRLVWATVYTPDGHADFTSVPVVVKQCATPPGSAPPIGLHFWQALRKPNVVELMVHNYDANGHEIPPPGAASYAWSFGDNQTATTTSPFVSHDYTAAIDALARYNYFDVSVTATTSRGTATARKVVPLWSLYAENRGKGIIQPPSMLSMSASSLTLTVTNYEPTPLFITQANVELIPCDPALESRPQTPQALSATVGGQTTSTVTVARPPAIASDVCSLGVHLVGSAATGRVYSDAYTHLKENQVLVQAITNPNTIALLNQASALTQDPNRFDEFELRQLYAQALIPGLPPSDPPVSPSQPITCMPGQASVMCPCTPGDTSPLGLVCAPTAGWVFVGPEILNAFKGNFIMDHGCGFIGQLLSSVNQLYSHTSTIVENRVMVRHSTASPDRMQSNVDYVGEKLDPNTLQFGFPGTAGPDQAYTIDQMVNQYFVTDPDNPGQQWRMGGELNPDPLKCDFDTTSVPPLVVRPAPDAPAADLQSVASVANPNINGINANGHYRFFNYSRGDKLLPGSDWATGTESTVCSSFDRLAAVGVGLQLHPTPKPNDPLESRFNLPGVPDGMRQYTVDERTIAGNALYSQMSSQVSAACSAQLSGGTAAAVVGGAGYLVGGLQGAVIGGLAGLLGAQSYCDSLSSSIANQINNCFANDGCDDTDSNNWANPGTGIAVSPDDIKHWETFHDGGAYGYNEPLVYQPKGYRHAYAWAASPGSGSMIVKVVHTDNTPFPNATVLINSNPLGTADSTGTFQIPTLAAANYDVGAQFFDTTMNQLEQADQMVTLPLNGSLTVVLTLCAGPVVNGVVTSCPQPQSGPRLTHVGIQAANLFNICIVGSGFTPGGPVDIIYTNVPGYGSGMNPSFSTAADAAGGINFTSSIGSGDQLCTNPQFNGQFTVTAFDNVSDVAAQETDLPGAYWCAGALPAPTFNGGCP